VGKEKAMRAMRKRVVAPWCKIKKENT